MASSIDILINGKDLTAPAVNSAKAGLAGLGAQVGVTSGKFSAATVAVGTVIGNLATTAISKMGEMIASVAKAGISFNNMKEQADIAFTTMLGSGGKAKSFLDDLQRFAAKTPFEFPELLQASQRMLAMGIESDKVLPTLTAIGDAVAGLGGTSETVGRVTTALGQMQAKGKVSAEEMMQLTEAGIPAWEMLADKIGVSVPEAMDLVSGKSKKTADDSGAAWKVMSDGVIEVLPKMKSVARGTEEVGITAAQAIEAITEGMNSKFGGMMEKQSKTFGGLWSTIKDTFTQVSGQVMKPFFDQMTNGFQMIVDWTSSPAFTGGVESFTKWIKMATDVAVTFFGDLVTGQPILDALSRAFRVLLPSELSNLWGEFVDLWGAMQIEFARLMDVITGKSSALDYFNNLWSNIWGLAQSTFANVTGYVTSNLPTWISTLQGWGAAAWQWIRDAIPLVLDKLGEWAGNLISWLGDQYPIFIKTFLEWQTALVKWIGDAIPKAINGLSAFIRGLRQTGEQNGTSSFVQMVRGWANTLWRWIKDDVIPAVGPAFMDLISALLSYGQNMLMALGGLASELGQTLWYWIKEAVPPALRQLGEWGQQLWGWIGRNLPVWMDALGRWGTAAWEWISKTAIPTALRKISEWGGALWGWVKENAPAWGDRLKAWGVAAWEWITKIAIPEALKRLGEWAGKLRDWVVENAPKWFETLKGWGVAAWEWITKVAIPGAIEKLGEWGQNLIDWVTENAPIWYEKLKTVGTEWINNLRDGVEIAWIEFVRWFTGETILGGFIGDVLQMLGVGITPAYGIFDNHGQQIAYSLRQGLEKRKNELGIAGADMGNAISSGLKTSLDMHSPSRVMWGFGEDIVASLQGGVRSGFTSLKSEMDYVAEQIKATMARANADMLAGIEYFTNQAAIKAQAAHYKIANATKDAAQALKDLGIDTSKVIGYGPNGELILPGVTNLPKSSTPAPIATPTAPTTTIGSAIGGNLTAGATSQALLGGISVATPDIKSAKDSAASAAEKVKQFIAGLGDFLGGTVDSRTMSRVFQTLDSNLTGNPELHAAEGKIRQSMADLLGIPTMYGRLSDNIAAVLQKIGAGTDLSKVATLLQSAVDFRTLANFYSTSDYANVLPTDTRLTGGNTTNNFNITLQGSSNASADVLGIVELLGSLQGTASP